MIHATAFLTDEQRREVEASVAGAERRTSAEIVCAVATESGRYDRAESIVGVVAGLLFLFAANLIGGEWGARTGGWADRGLAMVWQFLAVVLGFVAGSVLASYAHPVRRLFVSEREMQAEADRAASHVFALHRLGSTRSSGGVLIYVSLFERRAVVLADRGVVELLGQGFLDDLRDLAASRLHAGDRVGAFRDAVNNAADRLAEALPIRPDDANELPDPLVLIHPRP